MAISSEVREEVFGRSGSNGAPTSVKSGKRRERYLVIWNGYVACEHPTRNINIEVSS